MTEGQLPSTAARQQMSLDDDDEDADDDDDDDDHDDGNDGNDNHDDNHDLKGHGNCSLADVT